MQHHARRDLGQHRVEQGTVPHVALHEGDAGGRGVAASRREVIQDRRPPTIVHQGLNHVRADVARAARDQDSPATHLGAMA